MSRRLLLPLLALALSALGTVARAQEDAPAAEGETEEKASAPEEDNTPAQGVVVLPYAPLFGEIPQSQADKATDLVKNELSANKQFKVLDAAEGKGGAKKAGKSWEEDLAGAKKEVEDAQKTFEKAGELAKNKKMKPAADAYEKGIQQFLLNFQGADDFKALSDAYVQLSITRFKLGNEDEAIKILDDIVRLDPSRVLQPPEVVNLFAKLHDKARKAYLEKPRGQLKVTSVPAGARVTLDGRDIGETPLLGKGVVPGDHYLKVVKPGTGAFWKKISIASGEQTEIKAELSSGGGGALAGIAKGLQSNQLSDGLAKDVQKVGEASKADYVLFGAMRKGDDAYAVKTWAMQVKTGKVVMLAPLSFDTEMLGAGIEVFKLASDLGEKVKAFEGVTLDTEVAEWNDAKPSGGDEQLNVVTVTGTAGSAGGPQIASGGDDSGEKKGRRVVVSAPSEDETPKPVVEEKRKPIAAAEPEQKAEEAPVEETKPKLRERKKIGAEPEKKPVVEEEKPVEDEPKIVKNDKKKSVLDEVAEEEDKPKAKKSDDVDLKLKAKDRTGAALSMEEYKKLEQLENDKSEDSGTGKILLWSGVGVVGAAGLTYLGYVLLAPKTPTSATARITWTP